MKAKHNSLISPNSPSIITVCSIAATLSFGTLAGSAQTGDYLYSGSLQTVTLGPGLYDITAYGAQGGGSISGARGGGLGAEMSAEFSFSGLTTLTLLVGGGGGGAMDLGGGGGGGSFVVSSSTPLVIAGGGGGGGGGGDFGSGPGLTTTSGGNAEYGGGYSGGGSNGLTGLDADGNHPLGGSGGFSFEAGGNGGDGGGTGTGPGGYGGGGGGGEEAAGGLGPGGGGGGYSGGGGGYSLTSGGGGGSIIDSSAVAILAEVSGVASPDGSSGNPLIPVNGEIIITAVPEPTTLALAGLSGLSLLLFRRWAKSLY